MNLLDLLDLFVEIFRGRSVVPGGREGGREESKGQLELTDAKSSLVGTMSLFEDLKIPLRQASYTLSRSVSFCIGKSKRRVYREVAKTFLPSAR